MNANLIRHAKTEDEVRACFPVMQQLRPHLHDETDFVDRVNRMRAENYHLLAVWQEENVIAVAGYRHQDNLLYGRFLYVDDLVVSQFSRRGQWGARLLDALDGIARDSGCQELVLDTGLSNAHAQRFYFRHGLLTGAIRFRKVIEGSPT
ncbi:MAG: Histone acetyltransferase and related acetyltransferase [Pseudomonas sp.]|nr:Histone acetyltransferase and related acetyltransferase [Pseudomonas sp.]